MTENAHADTGTPQQQPPRPLFNIVRPRDDSKVAGVCAALGRLTNSDPMLWRVLFAVLVLFAGTGLLAYAALWLLTPAEGDTASPVEALIGRGESSTAAPLTVALGAGALAAVSLVFLDSLWITILLGIALIMVVVWLTRSEPRRRHRMVPPAEFAYGPPPLRPGVPPTGPGGPAATPPGYRAPFAPYGPYAAYTTQSGVRGTDDPARPKPFLPPLEHPPRTAPYPAPPARPYAAPPPPRPPHMPYGPPPAPRPPRPKSKLPVLTLSAMAVAIGLLGIIDLAGAGITFGWYVATALLVAAGGLLVGAWVGRARSMIAVGIVLSLMLMIYTTVSWAEDEWGDNPVREWEPHSVAAIQSSYYVDLGNGMLDLSNVPFKDGDDVTVNVSADFGELWITLPDDVDTTVVASVDFGEMVVFDEAASGSQELRTTDYGSDGKGGGELTINVSVGTGKLEVTR